MGLHSRPRLESRPLTPPMSAVVGILLAMRLVVLLGCWISGSATLVATRRPQVARLAVLVALASERCSGDADVDAYRRWTDLLATCAAVQSLSLEVGLFGGRQVVSGKQILNRGPLSSCPALLFRPLVRCSLARPMRDPCCCRFPRAALAGRIAHVGAWCPAF